MVTEYFISVPGTEDPIQHTIERFKAVGWKLSSVEKSGPEHLKNLKYTIGWPEEKGKPIYPPNIHIKNM